LRLRLGWSIRKAEKPEESTMGEAITLEAADGHRLSAWRDGTAEAQRALVVAQEIFGVNRHIRSVCARLAAEGYAVVAPSLFDRARRGVELGYTAEDVAAGRALRALVPEAGTLLDPTWTVSAGAILPSR
jgi:carboxymethylenebutenolidase